MTTDTTMSSTDEFVRCDCVAIVHAAYNAPTEKQTMLTGRKTRSGLKNVTTFTMIMKNFAPSRANLILELPCRRPASIGTNSTLYPALMHASVVVVGVEKPFGIRCRNSTSTVRF